jgi:hypothetical protein
LLGLADLIATAGLATDDPYQGSGPAPAGAVLTAVAVMLRGGVWGVITFTGLWFLLYALRIPASSDAERKRDLAAGLDWGTIVTAIGQRRRDPGGVPDHQRAGAD